MLRFATTNTLNNEANLNIALLDQTMNVSQDKVLQIDDLSTSMSENLTPLYAETILTESNNSGQITGINNKFKRDIKITDRYYFDTQKKLTIPLWYRYRPPTALYSRSASTSTNKFDVIRTGTAYKLTYADGVYVAKNEYKVYRRRHSWETWMLTEDDSYTINKAEDTITITNLDYNGYNIKVVNTTVSDPIRVYHADESGAEDYQIELIKIINQPLSGYADNSSIDNNYYINMLLHELPKETLYISFQSYGEYKTYIVNPVDIHKEKDDFAVSGDYTIETGIANTLFYIKLPNRNSIINANKEKRPQESVWNITIPREEVSIEGRNYYPVEANVLNRKSTITIDEKINQIDDERIQLTYDDIYVIRGIDNKPLNISIYSTTEDGTSNHDDIVDDIDIGNRVVYVSSMQPINKNRSRIRYQVQMQNAPIYTYNLNPHKMFNKNASLASIIIYMLPQDEVIGNECIFFFPVYNTYKYMDEVSEYHMSMNGAISYISSGDVVGEIERYTTTPTIHPIILGTISYIAPVSANDIEFFDTRRLGTDIAYDHVLDPYVDSKHIHYSTIGYWWGRPVNLDNVVVVYMKRSVIDNLKTRYQTYDLRVGRKIANVDTFNIDEYMMQEVILPKIRKHLRLGARLIFEIVEDE